MEDGEEFTNEKKLRKFSISSSQRNRGPNIKHRQNADQRPCGKKHKKNQDGSMECSSMVSTVTFGPGDTGSKSDWFDVSNSNQKLIFHK